MIKIKKNLIIDKNINKNSLCLIEKKTSTIKPSNYMIQLRLHRFPRLLSLRL